MIWSFSSNYKGFHWSAQMSKFLCNKFAITHYHFWNDSKGGMTTKPQKKFGWSNPGSNWLQRTYQHLEILLNSDPLLRKVDFSEDRLKHYHCSWGDVLKWSHVILHVCASVPLYTLCCPLQYNNMVLKRLGNYVKVKGTLYM